MESVIRQTWRDKGNFLGNGKVRIILVCIGPKLEFVGLILTDATKQDSSKGNFTEGGKIKYNYCMLLGV